MATKRNANKHRGRHVFRMYSKKNGCALKVESYLEYCHACILECDPNVKIFASQPETMNLVIDGKQRRYTPDFLVLYQNGFAEYIEVHPSTLISKNFRQRVEAFSEYSFCTVGAKIRFVTEEGLCPITRINYQLISKFASMQLSFDIHKVKLPKSPTFEELIHALSQLTSNSIAEAYHLLTLGIYEFDKTELLKSNTVLTEVSHVRR